MLKMGKHVKVRTPKAKVGGTFMILRSIDPKAPELDLFEVEKTIVETVGEILEATTTKTGEYLLKVQSDAQVAKFTRLKKLTNLQKIKCEIHPTRNQCRCVNNVNVKPQGVIEARGIKPSNTKQAQNFNIERYWSAQSN